VINSKFVVTTDDPTFQTWNVGVLNPFLDNIANRAIEGYIVMGLTQTHAEQLAARLNETVEAFLKEVSDE
jgi:hypothetical protein